MQKTETVTRNSPSYREALAWACLATILFTYIPYFRHVYWLLSGAPRPGLAFPYGSLATVRWTIVEQTILLAIATSAITLWRKSENRDERDAVIEARAYRYAYLSFIGLVFILLFAGGTILGAFAIPSDHPGAVSCLLQFLLLSFVVAEIIRYCIQLVGYRRGY